MRSSIFQGDPFDKRSPYKHQERARRKRLIRAIATGVIPGLTPIVILLGFVIIRNPSWQGAVSFGVTILIILLSWGARILADRERIQLGGYILLFSLVIIVATNGVLIEGFSIAVAPSYTVIVVMAGMMLGVSGGINIALFASALWLATQFGLGEGLLPEPLATTSGFILIAQAFTVVGFFFTAYMSYLSTEDLQQAFDDTTYELVNVNRQLENANKLTQRARQRVEAILNNSPDAIILLRGPDGGISTGNTSFYKMFALPEDSILNNSIINFIKPNHTAEFREALQNVISQEKTVTLEVVAITSDDKPFDAGIAIAPITGGELVRGIVCSIRDISERVQAEEQIIKSLKEKEILLQEVHHRVKNNLQVISGLLNLQIEEKGNPHTNRILSENRSRILSMARVHDQLYRSDDFTNVNLMVYTQDLIDQIFSFSDTSKDSININLNISNVSLDVNRTIYYGLIVNELVLNALKHAFPDGQSGEINITLEVKEEDEFVLTISDNGVGFPNGIDPTHSKTLGLSLVRMLTDQLEGELTIDNDTGTTIIINFSVV